MHLMPFCKSHFRMPYIRFIYNKGQMSGGLPELENYKNTCKCTPGYCCFNDLTKHLDIFSGHFPS